MLLMLPFFTTIFIMAPTVGAAEAAAVPAAAAASVSIFI